MRNLSFKAIATGIGLALIAAGTILFSKPDLLKIHDKITEDYERVEHIDALTFSKLEPDNVVIFDVREPTEYAVSHLPGAIQVDPRISEQDFRDFFGASLKDKTAIFYCSVGRRSSNLAERVADIVEAETTHAPINLIGGVFQWSNEDRSLITRSGAVTQAVHPYNAHWGRLIQNKDVIQYSPAPDARAQEDEIKGE